jgi:hypothetical protein
LFEFGPFRLDVRGRLLFREGERLPLPPKAADVLIALVENRGRAVGREDLLRSVWAGTTVEEGSLTSNVSLLRRILGETSGGEQHYIETIPSADIDSFLRSGDRRGRDVPDPRDRCSPCCRSKTSAARAGLLQRWAD